ncbi:hypothetical protein [Paenibacillus sp.]|uniref:hypothetical protein n=1 Tax=Paenibacillus sp. TaxID=58172 RepID=UPI0028121273|nr:hypothetical protein [Paenibacillus sp.]
MPQYIYIILVCFFLLVGIVGTIAVGVSKENREGNPEYERKTKGNWTRLTLYYVVSAVAGVVGLIAFIQFQS